MTAKEVDDVLEIWRRVWKGRETTDAALRDLVKGGAALERERIVAFCRAEIEARISLPFRGLARQHLKDAHERYEKGAR